jgi:hypothetical protein
MAAGQPIATPGSIAMSCKRAICRRSMPFAVLTVILFCGCASSGSKQGGASDESQTAETRQVILVPVIILSSPDGDSTGGKREVTPEVVPPDHSTGNEPSQHAGAPVKL